MKISPFQITEAKRHAGLVKDNHFSSLYEQSPQMAGLTMNRILENKYGTSLESYLDKYIDSALYFDDDRDYHWKLMGATEVNVPLKSARWVGSAVTSSTNNVGGNRGRFELIFGTREFDEGHIIVGEKNEIYPIYIEEMYRDGEDFVYVCVSALPDADGIPGEELVSGKLFSIEFSPVESSMSDRGTGIRLSTDFELRNGFTTTRKENTVPGNMKSRKMLTGFRGRDSSGKDTIHTMWIEYLDFILEHEFLMEKSRHLYYGRTNRDSYGISYMVGKSGNDIKIGAGLREQMLVSNSTVFTTFSLELLENQLMDLAEGKLGRDERRFKIYTGERGAKMISKEIAKAATGWTILRDLNSLSNVNSPLHTNALSFGYQFVQYLMPNGIVIDVEVDHNYSNQVRNKIEHPLGGKAESYRMDIFDIGTNGGLPNIQKAYVRGSENILRYEVGLRSPWDANSGTGSIISHAKDSWTTHRMAQHGVLVRDPERTASLIPIELVA